MTFIVCTNHGYMWRCEGIFADWFRADDFRRMIGGAHIFAWGA